MSNPLPYGETPFCPEPSIRWVPVIAKLGLLLLAVTAEPAALRVLEAARSTSTAISEAAAGFLVELGATLQAAAEESISLVAKDDNVRQRLGEPLQLPPLENLTWPERDPSVPSDQIPLRFKVAGPRGQAAVEVMLQATSTNVIAFDIQMQCANETIIIRAAPH